MTLDVRISGEPEEIDAFLAWLRSNGAETAGGDRKYANRGSFDSRAYTEVRIPQAETAAGEH